jgi:hypothetical protein
MVTGQVLGVFNALEETVLKVGDVEKVEGKDQRHLGRCIQRQVQSSKEKKLKKKLTTGICYTRISMGF